MARGAVSAICIAPSAGAPMHFVERVEAIAGEGLAGDRYARGEGSFNKGLQGNRQVTLINTFFVEKSGFNFLETRRNIVVRGIELMDQIGHEFCIDDVVLHGIKYCDPCTRPSALSGNPLSFRDTFYDRGGLVAKIVRGGFLEIGSSVVPRTKNY